MFIYLYLFTLVLKSPDGAWPIMYTFTFTFTFTFTEAKELRDSVGSAILKNIPTSSSGDTFVVNGRVFLACMFLINLDG